MPLYDFRSVHLPYCLHRLENGSYVVLNREYKPLGFRTYEHIDYESYPIAVKFKRLTASTIVKLSWKADPDPRCIFLYYDGNIPTDNAKDMQAYLQRLAILAKLTFTEDVRAEPGYRRQEHL